MNIIFKPDGSAQCLYTEVIPLKEIGKIKVDRASNVEYDAANEIWEVRHRSTRFLLFCHESRQRCLEWEHDNDLLLLEGACA